MTQPEEKTSSAATQTFALPSLAQHLREFAARPQAWIALGRNLIPVVGIYAFGWSAALAVFSYWFDGLIALAAIIAAVVLRLLREMPATQVGGGIGGTAWEIVLGVVIWIFLVIIIALPYWMVLIPLHNLLLGYEVRSQLAHSPALWMTFGSVAVGHFYRAFQAGYDTMPEKELRQRVRWDSYLLVLRAGAMFIMAFQGLAVVLVPLMALLLTYMEVWPERVLGAVWGDPSKLGEDDKR
jgi:hypothetical protein